MSFEKHVALYLVCYGSPPAFTVPSTFFTNRGFFSFSILNPFFWVKVISISCRVHRTSLTLSVVLVQFNLFPSFSGCNTLYRLLEASRELTILYFFLLTPVVFLLPFFYAFSNNFWPYGPTFYICSMFCPLLFLCLSLLHLGLFLDLFEFPLY